VIGSPDPYGKQIDGMGGATSSTSKTRDPVAQRAAGHDVDYLFGQVSIDKAFVDWSGNCGNLSAAVGPFAISGRSGGPAGSADGVAVVASGRPTSARPSSPTCRSRRQVQETGDFELDGVTFPAAEVQLEFMDPAAEEEGAGAPCSPPAMWSIPWKCRAWAASRPP
jgi:2-methylaconitate cis-trans-isomerase PrpF